MQLRYNESDRVTVTTSTAFAACRSQLCLLRALLVVLLPLRSGLWTLHVLLLVLVKETVVVLQALPLVLLLLLRAVAGLARCYGVVQCSESRALVILSASSD